MLGRASSTARAAQPPHLRQGGAPPTASPPWYRPPVPTASMKANRCLALSPTAGPVLCSAMSCAVLCRGTRAAFAALRQLEAPSRLVKGSFGQGVPWGTRRMDRCRFALLPTGRLHSSLRPRRLALSLPGGPVLLQLRSAKSGAAPAHKDRARRPRAALAALRAGSRRPRLEDARRLPRSSSHGPHA